MKKLIIVIITIVVLVLCGVTVYAIQGLDQTKSTRILANDGYATITVSTVGGTVETTKETLQSVVDSTSYEGLHVTDTYAVFTLNKPFLNGILSKAQGAQISFHFGYDSNKTEVTFNMLDSNNNTLFATEGRCLGEIPYTAASGQSVTTIAMKDPNNKLLALSDYYSDANMIHWQLNAAGTYKIVSNTTSFHDTTSHWGLTYIAFLTSRGVATGISDTLFAPDDSLTRAQFVAFMARVAGADISAAQTSQFTDVTAKSWYYPYVSWAYKAGIAAGVEPTLFAPEAKITREQMAVFTVRLLNYMNVAQTAISDAAAFGDAAQISSWATESVSKAQTTGIINGKDDGKFYPQGNATRAEAAAVCSRIISYLLVMPQ